MFKKLFTVVAIICLSISSYSNSKARDLKNCHNNGSSKRISSTGAIFTDTSNPALGKAYKDPSGLTWGSLVMGEDGKINRMSQHDADKSCKDGGARLPTKEEFKQLGKYLGKGTANGYNPYLADGETDLLPGLSGYLFWSSSVDLNYSDYAFYFSGYDGGVDDDYRDYRYNDNAVRCVIGR